MSERLLRSSNLIAGFIRKQLASLMAAERGGRRAQSGESAERGERRAGRAQIGESADRGAAHTPLMRRMDKPV